MFKVVQSLSLLDIDVVREQIVKLFLRGYLEGRSKSFSFCKILKKDLFILKNFVKSQISPKNLENGLFISLKLIRNKFIALGLSVLPYCNIYFEIRMHELLKWRRERFLDFLMVDDSVVLFGIL